MDGWPEFAGRGSTRGRRVRSASGRSSLAKNPLRLPAAELLASPCPKDHRRGGHYLSFSARGVGQLRRFPAVGQQFLDPAVRMRAHPVEHVTKVSEGIDSEIL